MRILLVMPEFETNKAYKTKWHFPFPIWYVGGYLKSYGYDVEILDFNLPWSDRTKLYLNFDYVGISCCSAQVPAVREICQLVKKHTKSRIILGGIHPTLYPEQTLESPLVDYIYKGHFLKNFANMPMLDYSLLDKRMMSQEKNWIGMVTSIGCPYKCTFCVNSIIDDYNKWQAWPAKRICDEIEKAQSYGFKNFFFWDDNFFTNKTRTESFIRIIHKRNLRFEWFALTRANHVDSKLFNECFKVGLKRVSIGAESGNNDVLKRLHKGITTDSVLETAKILNNIGIEASFSYMIGLPEENKKEIFDTVFHIKQLGEIQDYPKIVGPMIYSPYPGSRLYEQCKQAGWHEPKHFEEWTDAQNGNIDHPARLPWIKKDIKDMVSVYWFYSFLIPLSLKKIGKLYLLYKNRTKRGLGAYFFLIPIYIVALFGKLRHKFRFYRFPVETYLFRRFRGLIGT